MANEILKSLLPFGGWMEERIQALSFTGGTDPILPTSSASAEQRLLPSP